MRTGNDAILRIRRQRFDTRCPPAARYTCGHGCPTLRYQLPEPVYRPVCCRAAGRSAGALLAGRSPDAPCGLAPRACAGSLCRRDQPGRPPESRRLHHRQEPVRPVEFRLFGCHPDRLDAAWRSGAAQLHPAGAHRTPHVAAAVTAGGLLSHQRPAGTTPRLVPDLPAGGTFRFQQEHHRPVAG